MVREKQRALRTYGHHRNRCVLSDSGDVFRSADESRHHIFSTSSSESGFGPSDSLTSTEVSSFSGRPAKNKAKKITENKENVSKENNKRKRQPSRKVKLFLSDKDSSDCSSPSQKRPSRRGLRDSTNETHEQQTTKRKPAKRKQSKKETTKKNPAPKAEPVRRPCNSINFSEFDDYSLVISDSPPANNKSKKVTDTHKEHGTSTPCQSASTRTSCSPDIQTADISFIPVLYESFNETEHQDTSLSTHFSVPSPVLSNPESNPSLCADSSVGHTECEHEDSEGKNLEKLEESFASMRVSKRRSRPRKQTQKSRAKSPPVSRYETISDSLCTVDDDLIAVQCKTRVRKLKESLQKSVLACNEVIQSQSSVFDGSCCLFDSSVNSEDGKPAERLSQISDKKNEADDPSVIADFDSQVLNLSDIIEDGEDEEEHENSCEESEDAVTDLTHSFAEILTPAKALSDSGEELTPLQKVLEQCGQETPVPFTSIIPASILKKCVKIGEGVYGEVFRVKHHGKSVALKIIPIEGNFEVNDEPQKTFREILPEIVISNELSRLRDGEENMTSNFCPVNSVSLVKGCYPPDLLKQWDIYHEKKTSENDRPDVFGDEQLYILFEFGDGGCDLDASKLTSAVQAVSILQQVACALAVAEEELWFEHRDLHVGNILVQPSQEDTVDAVLRDMPLCIDTQGIKVNVIDFTLSRLTKDGCTVFCDLASDDSLFEGKGDYQFDIYRMMKAENKNHWESYHPYTNVMWLHYVCDKLIHHKRFQETGRVHREALKRLRQVYNSLLEYKSAAHFVLEDSFFVD